MEHYLAESGVLTRCYHGDVPLDQRRAAIAEFSGLSHVQEGQPVLVCTDLAARGLDIPGRVDHVVNFDFPLNPVDYIHRAGRTARAGNRGNITSLVTKGDRWVVQWCSVARSCVTGVSAQRACGPHRRCATGWAPSRRAQC